MFLLVLGQTTHDMMAERGYGTMLSSSSSSPPTPPPQLAFSWFLKNVTKRTLEKEKEKARKFGIHTHTYHIPILYCTSIQRTNFRKRHLGRWGLTVGFFKSGAIKQTKLILGRLNGRWVVRGRSWLPPTGPFVTLCPCLKSSLESFENKYRKFQRSSRTRQLELEYNQVRTVVSVFWYWCLVGLSLDMVLRM